MNNVETKIKGKIPAQQKITMKRKAISTGLLFLPQTTITIFFFNQARSRIFFRSSLFCFGLKKVLKKTTTLLCSATHLKFPGLHPNNRVAMETSYQRFLLNTLRQRQLNSAAKTAHESFNTNKPFQQLFW